MYTNVKPGEKLWWMYSWSPRKKKRKKERMGQNFPGLMKLWSHTLKKFCNHKTRNKQRTPHFGTYTKSISYRSILYYKWGMTILRI